jgi:intraflagellar transport protein 140
MFSHDLRDPLLHITFRKTVESSSSTELMNLAKLAVAGDEVALDTLTNWRPKTAARNLSHAGVKDNHCFYVGSQSGVLFYINQSGTCIEVLRNDSPIIQILFHPKREAIVTLMEDMTVGHFLVESSGSLTELDRVKLSSRISGYDGAISWAGNSLAIITGDLSVRIWDIDTSDNFLMPTDHAAIKNLHTKHSGKASNTEIFSSIAYCAQNQTLCAGTNQGSIYVWKKTNYKSEAENGWQLTDVTNVRGAIKLCIWGIVSDTLNPCIVVNCVSNVYILKEQPLMSSHTRDIWATQRSASQALVENSSQQTALVSSDIAITNLCLTDMNLILTNGKTIAVYKIQRTSQDSIVADQSLKSTNDIKLNDNLSVRFSTSFNCENLQIFIYEQNIICIGQNDITIMSLNGVKLQQVSFLDHEGKPIGSNLTSKYLTIFTLHGYIKVYDVSRHELKLLVPTKNAYDLFENFGEIIMAKANQDGSLVAMTIATENLVPDGMLHIWRLESDTILSYDFLQKDAPDAIPRLPITFNFDEDDHRLLACEARLIQQSKNSETASMTESQVYIMFPSNMKIHELEIIDLSPSEQLINLCAPSIITLKVGIVGQKTLRDFVGLQNTDTATRKMVLDFSLNVAQGNLDQAFICIRSLQSEAVWNNLAKMCVKTGRLDVAKICLGHLKKARSVRAIRKAMEDNTLESEAKTAVLAIELGMIEEAENLYKKCGRFDLLNKLLQNCGRFEEALKIAENFDRVHLKNTRMKYAQWMSENGDTAGAMKMYQLTSDPVHCITQMLMEDQVALRKYMQATTDPEMLKWYAQFVESTGDMESAFKIYQKAEDWFSQVRILCFLGQLSRADSVARHSGDKSACYHLARHYENIGKYSDAIQFYTRAQTFGNAVRICKENDLLDELWNVASAARSKDDKASAAAYFEENGDYKRAVELYHRAGFIHKAIEMAFASQQPDILQVIASELDAKSDPELISRCAEFFQSINLNQKAVLLLANARQFEKALEVISKHSVPITETLAEMLTPNKDEMSEEQRNEVLVLIGDLLQEQGDYHSATKK